MATYTKQLSDGYIKVAPGACQLQCKVNGNKLGVIHNDTAPSATDAPEFVFDNGVDTTLGTKDCYVIALSITPITFSTTEI